MAFPVFLSVNSPMYVSVQIRKTKLRSVCDFDGSPNGGSLLRLHYTTSPTFPSLCIKFEFELLSCESVILFTLIDD